MITDILTAQQTRAIALIGKVVTVDIDGDSRQGKVVQVQGDTWDIHPAHDGAIIARNCSYISDREDPEVRYDWQTPWGQPLPGWARLSQVRRGVNLRK